MTRRGRLVVIDLQEIFAAGPWGAPRFAEIVTPVADLVATFGADTIFTRFVAPADPLGAWREYYRQWPFALQPAEAPDYQLIRPYRDRATIDATTFGKWEALAAADGWRPGDAMVVCGVSTDCCVISTVLAAADAGIAVTVVADACAGVDDTSHGQALAVMALYAPLVRIATTAEVVAARGAADG